MLYVYLLSDLCPKLIWETVAPLRGSFFGVELEFSRSSWNSEDQDSPSSLHTLSTLWKNRGKKHELHHSNMKQTGFCFCGFTPERESEGHEANGARMISHQDKQQINPFPSPPYFFCFETEMLIVIVCTHFQFSQSYQQYLSTQELHFISMNSFVVR